MECFMADIQAQRHQSSDKCHFVKKVMHLKNKLGVKRMTFLFGFITRLEVRRPALALPLRVSTVGYVKVPDILGLTHFYFHLTSI